MNILEYVYIYGYNIKFYICLLSYFIWLLEIIGLINLDDDEILVNDGYFVN